MDANRQMAGTDEFVSARQTRDRVDHLLSGLVVRWYRISAGLLLAFFAYSQAYSQQGPKITTIVEEKGAHSWPVVSSEIELISTQPKLRVEGSGIPVATQARNLKDRFSRS